MHTAQVSLGALPSLTVLVYILLSLASKYFLIVLFIDKGQTFYFENEF